MEAIYLGMPKPIGLASFAAARNPEGPFLTSRGRLAALNTGVAMRRPTSLRQSRIDAGKRGMMARSGGCVVGATGIEPVTPTMSR